MKNRPVPRVGDTVVIKNSGQSFEVSKVEVGSWSGQTMVRVLVNSVPKWYYLGELVGY